MSVVWGLCVFFGLFLGSAMSAVKVEQNLRLFASKAATAVIPCSHNDSSYTTVLWYQQKTDSTAMDLIGYTVGTGNANKEKGFNDRFKLNRIKTTEGDLTISDLSQSDSAVYYCAAMTTSTGQPAYFGAGTKLTVLDPDPNKITKPEELKVKLLNHSSEEECTEKRVTLVCLAEDFYPDHIDLAWYIDDKEESTGVAKDDSAKLNTDNTYSISSRLSIPFKKWNQGNTYTCKLTFYYPNKTSDGTYKADPVTKLESLTAPKRDNPSDKADKYTRQGRTTMVAYGLFIAKSVLYGLFVIVIVRRQRFVSK